MSPEKEIYVVVAVGWNGDAWLERAFGDRPAAERFLATFADRNKPVDGYQEIVWRIDEVQLEVAGEPGK